MKGRKPTKRQKALLRMRRLDPENWLIVKNPRHEGELHIRHRESGRERKYFWRISNG
jgi:hypothetical protein